MIITNIIEGGMSSPIIGTNYSQRPAISTRFTEEMRKMNTKPEKSGNAKISGQPAIWMENTNSFGTHHATFMPAGNQSGVVRLQAERNLMRFFPQSYHPFG